VVPGDVVTLPNGTVKVNPDGTLTVTPNPGYTGEIVFPYSVLTPEGTKVTAVDTVRISRANDDKATTTVNTPKVIDVLKNDSVPTGSVISTINGQPVKPGDVIKVPNATVTINTDNTVTVTPDKDYTGIIEFDYTAKTPTGSIVPAKAIVEIPSEPKMEILKKSKFIDADNNGFANIGDRIEYSFEIKNTGNSYLTDIVINDNKCNPITPNNFKRLDVGQSIVGPKCTYLLNQDDLNGGVVENQATAVAKDPSGKTVTDKSDSDDVAKTGNDDPTLTILPKPIKPIPKPIQNVVSPTIRTGGEILTILPFSILFMIATIILNKRMKKL
ncbi:MAG: DUF7507 domain-containing protein, partial [Patescibacteria group bacterium]